MSLKLSKGFKCPKSIKRVYFDPEERRIMMRAHERFTISHRESLKKKGESKERPVSDGRRTTATASAAAD